jgi:23S rRNA (adenine1618-N6)-methyltransferase
MQNKGAFHPRNRHQGHYDFERLMAASPELARFAAPNRRGELSIDFTLPEGVQALNRAILEDYYGLKGWEIPKGFLCPAIPGRADYIHQVSDLLAGDRGGSPPRGPEIRVLDIGTGASCIFPILGFHEYGWSFTGVDVNPVSLASAQAILDQNPDLGAAVTLKFQEDSERIFRGVLNSDGVYEASVCNPPFHSSPEEAALVNRKKWIKMGRTELAGNVHEKQRVNFGGQGAELWCEGGELNFLKRMIRESAEFKSRCRWFTTLVSKGHTLAELEKALDRVGVRERRVLPMEQGQKKSRVLAWTFQ